MLDDNGISTLATPQVYTDLNGLAQLKSLGKTDKAAALESVAKQFESMLVQMMMKSMREANSVFGEDDMTASNESRFYQDMFDSQLAVSLSQGKGFGIAAALLRQLQNRAGVAQTSAAEQSAAQPASHALNAPAHAFSLEHVARVLAAVNNESAENAATAPRADARAVAAIQETLHRLFGSADYFSADASKAAAANIDGTPSNFVEALRPLAQRVARTLGVDSDILISQAALETGWGQKVAQCADGRSSFNFFNIKADASWQGDVVKVPTIEYRDGVAVREWASFRAYNSPEESFADYARFIADNPRYKDALECADDPRAYVQALAQAGYATDPRYAQKVLAVYDGAHLQARNGEFQ